MLWYYCHPFVWNRCATHKHTMVVLVFCRSDPFSVLFHMFLTPPVLSLCVWHASSMVHQLRRSSGLGTTGRLLARANLPSLRNPSAAASLSTMSPWTILEDTASLCATSMALKRLMWPWASIRVGRSLQQMLWRWVKTANWVRNEFPARILCFWLRFEIHSLHFAVTFNPR